MLDQIKKLCTGKHPSRLMPFDDLYNGLMARVQADRQTINVQYDGLNRRALFNYSKECQFGRNWDEFTMIARGLILDLHTKAVVATPFLKFFNYAEDDIVWVPSTKFTAYEKLDGSLGIFYRWQNTDDWWNGPWQVATRGSMFSDHSKTASQMMSQMYRMDRINHLGGVTLLAEIIHPQHRIVIPYDQPRLVLLGGYHADGSEIGDHELDLISAAIGFDRPEIYSVKTLEDAKALVDTFPYDQEGFVIKYENGYRVKIKGKEYCKVHKAICDFSPLAVYDLFTEQGPDLDQYKKALPEEFWDEFDSYLNEYICRFDERVAAIRSAYANTELLSKKEIALDKSLPDYVRKGVLEERSHGKYLVNVLTPGTTQRRSFSEFFRPKGNIFQTVAVAE
ncbi:MAG: hypothetical protein HC888_03400 [Candidatus Competibacteraceae bacterium]|nr:hypothetical protein [Candidatus Competibacteraceae bacterium]